MKKRFSVPLWVLGLVVLVVAARIALPFVVRDQLNQRLADMGDYSGHVADVDIALWRGAYVLNGLEIKKVTGEVPVPFFRGPAIDISLSWRHLFRGRVVGEVAFHAPELHFVDGRGDADSQRGEEVDWRQQLAELMPFQLNEVLVHDGTVWFNNFLSDPPIEVAIESIEARIENLGNVERPRNGGTRTATLDAEALVVGEAPLETRAVFDPIGRTDDFEFHLRVTDLQLVHLNDLAREYAALDFESGHGEFVMELEASDGMLDGYAKPLFHDMQIFSWQSDVVESDKNPLRVAWEAAAELVTSLFQARPEDQFATRVPIRGSIEDRQYGVFAAVAGILRNAFIEAYRADFERLDPRSRDDAG